MDRLLHTPEGVRDIFHDECERKQKLQNRLHRVLRSYGYRDIETPTFEYFDVFNNAVGTTPSKDQYKFFDREGNTLVLRPDITPSIARAVSRYFTDDGGELRFCYQGNTFVNNSSYQGLLKETTHVGAEFIGSASVQADAEAIAMAVDCLKASGLEEFQISIGQLDFFKSIIKDIALTPEDEKELKDLISNRNIFGAGAILDRLCISGPVKNALMMLPELYGNVGILEKAEKIATNEAALLAVKRLQELYQLLDYYQITRYISFDFSLLSRYDYYTGIFFRAYTFGSGDAVLKGGRYDRLLQYFGKNAPSVGFVVVIDELLSALEHQQIKEPCAEIVKIYCAPGEEKTMIRLAKALRADDRFAVMDYTKDASDEARRKEMAMLCKQYHITGQEEL